MCGLRSLCLSHSPGDSLLCHVIEVFISLFPSSSALHLESTGVRWGEGHVLWEALAGLLPPFRTALQQHRCQGSPVQV